MEFSSIPTVCTCNILCSWDLDEEDEDDEETYYERAQKNKNLKYDFANQRKRQGYKTDFAMLIVILTDAQLRLDYGKIAEEWLGFERVFVAPKDRKEQREKESGALNLYVTTPDKYQTAVQKMLEDTQPNDISEYRKQSFPVFTMTQFHELTWKKYLMDSPVPNSNFSLIGQRFGYNPFHDSEYIQMPFAQKPLVTFRWVRDRQILWREGRI